ncbi:MAG: 6-carboxytetrahydropterin synthase [Sarcina sp.]
MIKFKYKFKFYVNAKHSVTINSKKSSIHPHTWEIVTFLAVSKNEIINFSEFENNLKNYFLAFEGKYLNELTSFKNVEPTMEHMACIFFNEITELIESKDFNLDTIEISENPTRTYIVSSLDSLSND